MSKRKKKTVQAKDGTVEMTKEEMAYLDKLRNENPAETIVKEGPKKKTRKKKAKRREPVPKQDLEITQEHLEACRVFVESCGGDYKQAEQAIKDVSRLQVKVA